MEIGRIANEIRKLFKKTKREELASATGDIKTLEQSAWQANRQREAEDRPLEPLLQKNRDIVERFAQAHGLKVVVSYGAFLLKKELENGFTYQVVSLMGNEDCISINVYKAGRLQSDDYLTLSLRELLYPIYNEGKGDQVLLINRDIKDPTIAGELIADTRTKNHPK